MRRSRRYGFVGLSPLLVLGVLFVVLSSLVGGFSKVSLPIVFILTSVYALTVMRSYPFSERIEHFSRGAANSGLMQMIWIFILAGAFAASARAMGAVDSIVSSALSIVPAEMLPAGFFVAACLVSLGIGTSVGTVVALVPIAVGLAPAYGFPMPLVVAATVGGAFFGDNLSFISDTTVAATRTQGCAMSDKFKVNFSIVFPAALLTLVIYAFVGMGQGRTVNVELTDVQWLKVLPYLAVLILALTGMNVLMVLFFGLLLTGIIGISTDSISFISWFEAIGQGIQGMSELIVVSLLAGGLLEFVRSNGGIIWLIWVLTRRVNSIRGAEFAIAALVSLTNLCTANNTVAILTVGHLSHDIALRYGVDPRKSASLLDTFSCVMQGLIPYGAQLLMAGGLAKLNPMEIIPWMYYPLIVLVMAILSIVFFFPRRLYIQKP